MNQNKALELTKDIATDIIGGIPVSYTHLDVYKRQPSGFSMKQKTGTLQFFLQSVRLFYKIFLFNCCFFLICFRNIIIDVYKRQARSCSMIF